MAKASLEFHVQKTLERTIGSLIELDFKIVV